MCNDPGSVRSRPGARGYPCREKTNGTPCLRFCDKGVGPHTVLFFFFSLAFVLMSFSTPQLAGLGMLASRNLTCAFWRWLARPRGAAGRLSPHHFSVIRHSLSLPCVWRRRPVLFSVSQPFAHSVQCGAVACRSHEKLGGRPCL